MNNRFRLSISLVGSVAVAALALGQYQVVHDFNSSWSGSMNPFFADRTYTGAPNQVGGPESLASMTYGAGLGIGGSGAAILGNNANSPLFSAGSSMIAGARIRLFGENPGGYDLSFYNSFVGTNALFNNAPVAAGFDNAERRLYEQAMRAQFLPYFSVDFNYAGPNNSPVQFRMFANSPTAGFSVGRATGNITAFADSAFTAALANLPQPGWNNLKLQIRPDGRMDYLLNGSVIHTSTGTYAHLSNPFSGSLTVELTSAPGGVGSIALDNFTYGSTYTPVPEPMTLAGLGLIAAFRRRRKVSAAR